jgi:hypothetical protein
MPFDASLLSDEWDCVVGGQPLLTWLCQEREEQLEPLWHMAQATREQNMGTQVGLWAA